MPRIPAYQPGQVGPVQTTDARLHAADNNGGVFGALGQGLRQTGQALGQQADMQQHVDTLHAEAATKDVDNQILQTYATAGYDGPNAFYNLTGQAALHARETFEKSLADAIANGRNQLRSSPVALRMFEDTMGQRQAEWTRQIGQHVFNQTRAYAVDSSSARIGLAHDGAVHSALDASDSDKHVETIRGEVVNLGQMLGWSPEHVQLEQHTRVSAARRDVGTFITNTGPGGPAAAQAYADLHQGDFTGDDFAGLHVEIVGAQRAQAVAQAREAAVGKAQFTEQAQTAKADAARGVDVSARLPTLIKTAGAYGDTSTASELRGLLGDQQFAKGYQQTTPLQREQRVGQLAALKQPSDAQQQELKWLRDHGGALDSQFNADPAGFMVGSGHAPPPLGPARAEWAAGMSRAAGRPVPPLTLEEARQMQAFKANGSGGEDQVLNKLDMLPEGAARASAARMVAPDDAVFQHMAQVNPASRPTIRAGAEAIKANSKMFNLPGSTDLPEAMTGLDAKLATALKEFSPADAHATADVARQFLAGVMSRTGLTADKIDDGLYTMAVRVALGGRIEHGRQLGGLGDWGGHPYVLADGSTEASFAQSARAYMGTHKPTNRDGSPISLSSIFPVMIGPNTYRFEARDGRVVADQHGKPIVIGMGRAR